MTNKKVYSMIALFFLVVLILAPSSAFASNETDAETLDVSFSEISEQENFSPVQEILTCSDETSSSDDAATDEVDGSGDALTTEKNKNSLESNESNIVQTNQEGFVDEEEQVLSEETKSDSLGSSDAVSNKASKTEDITSNQYLEASEDAMTTDLLTAGTSSDFAYDPDDSVEYYVANLYYQVLGRSPDAEGFASWCALMRAGTGAAVVTQSFFASPEYLNRKLSETQAVETVYISMLDRNPDYPGCEQWISCLNKGASEDYVVVSVSECQEYINRCKALGLIKGTISTSQARDRNIGVTAYCSRLYNYVLERKYDVDGLNSWCTFVFSGGEAGAVAQGFFNSKEFSLRALSSDEIVNIAYASYFDRVADSGGFAHWKARLDCGMSVEVITVGFGNSQEFRNLCVQWGVNAGTVSFVRNESRDRDYNLTSFVSRLYVEILDRNYDVDGLNHWCDVYFNGSNAYGMAKSFFCSEEFSQKGLSPTEITEHAYRALFNREAELQGRSDWAHRLLNGLEMQHFVTALCQSEEFRILCNAWSMRVGDPHLDIDITPYNGYGVTDYVSTVGGVTVLSNYLSKAPYLLLSSCADLSSLTLSFMTYFNESEMYVSANKNSGYWLFASGDVLDVIGSGLQQDANGAYVLYVKDYLTDVETGYLYILKSSGVLTMYVISDDPENYGREYVEASADHSAKASATMILLDTDGTVRYGKASSGSAITIKGRGNSTWTEGEKKPYQIKLDKKTALLKSGQKSKTWILLANAADATLIHNAISLDLAAALGLSNTPEYDYVDFYYDGEYRGSYILCEKVEVGSGRVDIDDLDDANKEANPEIDIESQPVAHARNKYGYEYTYVEGIVSPQDITGGYLLEVDTLYASKEVSWFATSLGLRISVKSPEYATQEEMIYISELFEEALQCIQNNGTHPSTLKTLEQYFDMDSLAALFLVKEIGKDMDFFYTSTFFYKKAGDNKLYSGPMWDADTSFGIRLGQEETSYNNYGLLNGAAAAVGQALLSCESFNSYIGKVYNEKARELLVDGLLSKNTEGGDIPSISSYVQRIAASQKLDQMVWGLQTFWFCIDPFPTYEENVSYLVSWLRGRTSWLDSQFC